MPQTGEANERRRGQARPSEGHRFEQLLGDITAAFLNAPANEIGRQIDRALQGLGEFLGVDRATITEFSEDSKQLRATHVWSTAGREPAPRTVLNALLPWYTKQILRGEVWVVSSLDELPEEAVLERQYAQRLGVNSIVTIPLVAGGTVLGALACGSFRAGRIWPEEVVQRLRLVGAVFASALTRKRATESSRESEEAYRWTFEESPLGMAIVGPDFRYVRVNPTLCRMLGYSKAELTSLTFVDVTHPEHVEHNVGLSRRLRAGQIPSFRVEKRYLRKDGTVLWASTTVSVIHDEHGNVLHTLAMVEDITERKQALAALEESEQKYRRLFATVSDAILVFDAETLRFVDVNDAAVSLYGYTREKFLTLRHLDITAEAEESTASIEQTLNGKLTRIPLRHHRKKDGTVFPVEISASTFKMGDRTLLCGIVRDITERRQIEEELRQAQKMEAVGQLAGGIAHDFRNQLFAIKLCVGSLLRRSLVTSEGREYVDDIVQAADRSAELASQLLAFSRKEMLQPKATDLSVLVEDIPKSLSRMIGEDIRLSIVPADCPCVANVDPGQFQNAIMNMATNARDAMPDGGELTIETASVELGADFTKRHPDIEPGRHTMLTVSDTGAGMDPRTLERIFEPFFTTKEAAAGSGLGLSMVYGFVKQSGGAIEVESEPGKGSTFRLYFPCGAAVAEPARSDEAGGPLPRGTETILVAEDEEAVRRMLAVSLRESGYTVLATADAAEALSLAAQQDGRIDLLIADVVMPGMSGVELADRMRSRRPELAILFISGYTGTELSRRGLDRDNADLMIKPFSHQQLIRAARRTLDAARTPGGGD